ncbi:HOG (high osmolarity glycerol) pathway protein [Elasticomyces elasticus]|nr:HOG (high osmolarity glycerol) pathway protein [Elasticomyces elasticus]KAK3669025.1 HOG (high osmolarity glycerol) pathway protein [Elasticomyces elasticus]KAK4922676.1 HOG (high osmolarity glycerol) pathway protein [Elasticomyces elasticus]KAK5760931.1 HOG (high osmolarity glycerol) pathway protein [Elasticomyces elasticus]
MSSSRPPSTTTTTPFPNFQSALAYTLVRDFAWPDFHPLHYGAPDVDSASGATTPASEWPGGSRRLSDPDAQFGGGGGGWSAGPWGGDGVMYGDPESSDLGPHGVEGVEALPATSFGEEGEEEGVGGSGRRKHRKSRSYANMTDYERGRRRESAQSFRRSRASNTSNTTTTSGGGGGGGAGSGEGTGGDIFTFHGLPQPHSQSLSQQSQYDPAGRDSLRQSRGYINTGPSTNLSSSSSLSAEASARSRADSHFQTLLPSRSFGARDRRSRQQQDSASQAQPPGTPFDPDTHMPLDTEAPLLPTPQNLRESLGPEDEELYAGRSLALYPFEPENSNELRLREGQVIMGWLVAEDAETGEQGLVPEEYVRLLSELPHYDEVSGQFMDPEEGEDLGGDGGEGEEEEESEEVDTSEVEVVDAGHGGGKGKETRVDTPESGEVHELGGGEEVVGEGGR